jgi:hypothetical protein
MADKQLTSLVSLSGVGFDLEREMQTLYTILMLTGGYTPCFPRSPITKIALQQRNAGVMTDDLRIHTEQGKMFAQVKRSINVTDKDSPFVESVKNGYTDYCNPEIFDKENDCIAILTKNLSSKHHKVLDLLNTIHSQCGDSTDIQKICDNGMYTYFSVFKSILGDKSDEEVFCFLKRLFIFTYDLEYPESAIRSLAFNILKDHCTERPEDVWEKVLGFVRNQNSTAGVFDATNVPHEIKRIFGIQEKLINPAQLLSLKDIPESRQFALLSLFGCWNAQPYYDFAKNELGYYKDLDLIKKFTGLSDADIAHLHTITFSPIESNNNFWRIRKKKLILEYLGGNIINEKLNEFAQIAIQILSDDNPNLNDDATINTIFVKEQAKYSSQLKASISDTLAILGNNKNYLSFCTEYNIGEAIRSVVNGIFSDADWKRLASLSQNIHILSEADPKEFINQIEKLFNENNNTISDYMTHKSSTMISDTYYSADIRFALEALAWHEEYFMRSCTLILKLAATYSNLHHENPKRNPFSECLIRILLPWHPQTLAGAEKRMGFIKNSLFNNSDDKLQELSFFILFSLLPTFNGSSTIIHTKPQYILSVSDDNNPHILLDDYREQITDLVKFVISKAETSTLAFVKLVENLSDILFRNCSDIINRVFDLLNSESNLNLDFKIKNKIWNCINDLIKKNEEHPNAKWRLSDEIINRLKNVMPNYEPCALFVKWRNVFDRNLSIDHITEEKRVYEQGEKALKEIINVLGFQGVIDYIEQTNCTQVWAMGGILAKIDNDEIVNGLLPKYINDSQYSGLSENYVSAKSFYSGFEWFDNLDKTEWSVIDLKSVLLSMHFNKPVWTRADKLLGENSHYYWNDLTDAYFHLNNETTEIIEKIDVLFEHKRYDLVIQFLGNPYNNDKIKLPRNLYTESLNGYVQFNNGIRIDEYYLENALNIAIHSDEINENDKSIIEWRYLPFIRDHMIFSVKGINLTPIHLFDELNTSPETFISYVRLYFRSSIEEQNQKAKDFLGENANNALENIHCLFDMWNTLPGINEDNSFNFPVFKDWYDKVLDLASKSGHIINVLHLIGKKLIGSSRK